MNTGTIEMPLFEDEYIVPLGWHLVKKKLVPASGEGEEADNNGRISKVY